MTVDRINEWAYSKPTRTAIIYNDTKIDYATFARAVDGMRISLVGLALPPGKTAIVLANNPLDEWVFVLSLRSLGLNTIVASLKRADALRLNQIACIVVSKSALSLLNDAPKDRFTGIKIVTVPSVVLQGDVTLRCSVDTHNRTPFGDHIIYTSGTTGTFKKLLLSGAFENRRNEVRAHTLSLGKDTIYHANSLGLWTTVGFRYPSAVWAAGGCVVYDRRPGMLSRFWQHRINMSVLVPPMLESLLALPSATSQRHDDCELLITAGFLPTPLAEKAITTITKRIGVAYGSSELGSVALLSRFPSSSEDVHWLTPPEKRIVQIVDESGIAKADGELRILLDEIDCKEYMDDEETTARFFRDGWFYPGDMAMRRGDGRIRIRGRTGDVLNVGGVKIAVSPIEQKLQCELEVDEVCLFTGLNTAGQEELVVAIQSVRSVAKSKLDAARSLLPAFQRIRVVTLKQFPRTDTGTMKTRRSDLKRLIFKT